MPFQNTQLGFLYRQFFVTPPPLPTSLSLKGKTGIVTGSNTGLGYEASSQLLSRGLSRLILAVRDESKGRKARESLLKAFSDMPADGKDKKKQPVVEVWKLDSASYDSIRAFAKRLQETPDLRVDFIVLNAGVVNFEFQQNESTGHETTVQINWLSNALLCTLLAPILQAQYERAGRAGEPPVLSIVGSEVAGWAKFAEAKEADRRHVSVLKMLDDEKNFDSEDRYYTSKLLLLCFFLEFVARLDSSERRNDVVVNNVNPGFCYGTELHRTADGTIFGRLLGVVKRIIGRSTAVGARTLAHGAVMAGPASHGKYLSDGKVTIFADYVSTKEGVAMQKQLWKEAAEELGLE